ncbi:hypothetical protein [Defluviitalea phaphyphila]|uniref:hypothetical protein n=1 Tax=Defluviitalea phaphyphila TaxID=1473580 RepID=UPI001FA74916|nr:hypothetical protein [Defluviitalea phaphyphila]
MYVYLICIYDKNNKIEGIIRKIYFIYTYFFLLYIFPKISEEYNIWEGNGGIFNLNEIVSTAVVIFIISVIIYIIVISDFNISEISFGNTKISMLKERYKEEINSHFKNTNQLLKKIEAEGYIIYNMKEYCQKVRKRIYEKGTYISTEYEILLTKYFNRQKDKIKVSILQKLDENELRKNFGFKSDEICTLKCQLENNELYSTELDNTYYLFIPFCYIFEELLNEKKKPVYIVLEAKTPISVEAESNIIRNILIKFADDLLQLL